MIQDVALSYYKTLQARNLENQAGEIDMPLFESLADDREAFIVEEMAEEYLLFPSDLHLSSERD